MTTVAAAAAAAAKNKSYYVLLGPAWTRAFRCVWMLEELHYGGHYELDEAVQPGSTKVRAFVPSGKLPVLLHYNYRPPQDHGQQQQQQQQSPLSTEPFVLYESTAINTYLGEGSSLVPRDKYQRAIYDQTISCIATELDAQGLWLHRKHAAMGKVFGEIPAAVVAARSQFEKMNAQIAAPILRHPYLLGNEFTAADILYVHCLDWSKSIGWHDHWPSHLDAYRKLCHDRPAYQRAVQMRDRGIDERRQRQLGQQREQEQQQPESQNNPGRSKL